MNSIPLPVAFHDNELTTPAISTGTLRFTPNPSQLVSILRLDKGWNNQANCIGRRYNERQV